MLEQLRDSSRSLIIWVLFGIIIAAFVLTFGPQAEIGCGAQKVIAMTVNGKPVDQYAWRFGSGLNIRGGPTVKTPLVMDLILQRELLAQASEALGFRVSAEQAAMKLAKGDLSILGVPVKGKDIYFEEGVANSEIIERFARATGLPSTQYLISEQQREILANLMRQTLTQTVHSTRDEILAQYTHNNTTATIDFIKFKPSDYRRKLVIEDAHVAAFLADHGDKVKAKYKEDEQQYKGRGPEIRARHLLIRKKPKSSPTNTKDLTKDPAKAPEANDPKANDPKANDPKTIDPKAKAEKIHASLVGGADFATLAKADSEDARSAKNGGDLGWRPINSLGWGKEVVEAAKKLEVNKVSDIIESSRGFHILRIEDKREGDLSYDQVKHEIAKRLALTHYAREGARRDAQAAMEQAKAGKPLSDLFERAKPSNKGPQLTPDMLKNLTPEQREQLFKQMQKRGKSGSLFTEGPTKPASWNASNLAITKPLASKGPFAMLPFAAKEAASASKKAISTTSKTPAPIAKDVAKPKLTTAGPFTRHKEYLRDVGNSPEAILEIFEKLEPGQLASKVFEVDNGFVLLSLVNRQQPDLKRFETDYESLQQAHAQERAQATVTTWLAEQCKAAVKSNAIQVSDRFLSYTDDKGKVAVLAYQPCSTFDKLAGR